MEQYDPLDEYFDVDKVETATEHNDKVNLKSTFFDDKWCVNRAVTSIDWNPKYPELFAASYYSSSSHSFVHVIDYYIHFVK